MRGMVLSGILGSMFLLGTVVGSFSGWRTKRAITSVSQAGRDQALAGMLQSARRNVYLRTERLTLVPAGNELVQAMQRGVRVTVDLPLAAGFSAEDGQLPRALMGLGAIVSFRSGPAGVSQGTLVEVDGERFLYSAAPLQVMPGVPVSYVAGVRP